MMCKGSGAVNVMLDKSTGGRICPVCYDNVNASGPVYPHTAPSGLRFRCIVCFQGRYAFGKETVCKSYNGEHHMVPYPFRCEMCGSGVRTKEVGVGGLCSATYGGIHILPVMTTVAPVVPSQPIHMKELTYRQLVSKKRCVGCGRAVRSKGGTTKCLDCLIKEVSGSGR